MNDKIAFKIQKLLDKANDTDFGAESEVFLAKAYELMDKHNLSLEEIKKLSREEELGSLGSQFYNKGEEAAFRIWKRQLMNSICKLFDCSLVIHHSSKNKIQLNIIGRESNRITVEIMFKWIHDKTMKEAKSISGTAAKNAYCVGVADAISRKVNEIKRNKPKADIWGIIPYDENQKWIKENIGELSHTKSVATIGNTNAYIAGKKAGENTSLNKQFGLKMIA